MEIRSRCMRSGRIAESAGQTIPPGDPTSDPTFKEGLKGLIAQKLLSEEVKKYDEKVDDTQVDKYIEDVEADRHITDQQFRQSLMQNGVSWDDFSKQAKVELEKAMMLNEELRQQSHDFSRANPGLLRRASGPVHRQAGKISARANPCRRRAQCFAGRGRCRQSQGR